jgi:hypothetical protein
MAREPEALSFIEDDVEDFAVIRVIEYQLHELGVFDVKV